MTMENFAAIDFETANNERTSICSIGLVVVREGEITDTFYSLVQPEPNYYSYWCSRVHGLTRADTDEARVFPYVWAEVEPLIEGLPLVAHNKAFPFLCTLRASRRAFPQAPDHQLHTVSELCGFHLLHHHHALADAEACAWIAREIL